MPAIMLIAVLSSSYSGGAVGEANGRSEAAQDLGTAVKNLATQCEVSAGLGKLSL